MKVAHQREVRNALEKTLNALGGAAVFFDASVRSAGGLVRQRMLDDVDVAAVPISQKNSKTFLLVDLDSRDQKGPERVGRNIDIHGDRKPLSERVRGPDCSFFGAKKGPLFQAAPYLGLRA